MTNWIEPKVFAARHKDEEVRAASRSGGIFTALSDTVFEKGGVVYGCVLDKRMHAVHVRATNEAIRDLMRGSKYIQSQMGDSFKSIKSDLEAGRHVLFSGTSCQVAGLKRFLGKEWNNLLCVDIVCHGVPSPNVWKEYLKWQESKKNNKIIKVDFRNKRDYGWREHIETLYFENGPMDSRVFTTLFYGHCTLRPSCYECPYKSVMHPGDITIADYWGVEKAAPELDDNKGVSLVLINNQKGEEIFGSIKEKMRWKVTRIEDSMQLPLKNSCSKPAERSQFWYDFQTKNFEFIAKRYGGYSLKSRVKRKLGTIKRKLIK